MCTTHEEVHYGQQLGIPIHAWFQVAEKDGRRDSINLMAQSFSLVIGESNDATTGWCYLGNSTSSTAMGVDQDVDIESIVESGAEELYIVGTARPDIGVAISFSETIVRDNNRVGFILPPIET